MIPTIESHMGIPMPAMLYGTAWKEKKTADCVELALSKGFVGVDTACQPKHYYEPGVGVGLRNAYRNGIKRENLFIQTKFTGIQGQDPKRVPYNPEDPIADQVQQSVGVSLENLGTDYLDSLVLHGPLQTWEKTVEVWKSLEWVVRENKTRQIGVSNIYDPKMLLELLDTSEIKPATLQNRFYRDTKYDLDIRRICKENGIVYQCFWTLTANPQILESPIVLNIANELGKTPAQIFFRFIHQWGIQILTGTTSPEHMEQDLEIFDFELNDQQMAKIQPLGPF